MPVLNEDEKPENHGILYLQAGDRDDLIKAIEYAFTLPKVKMSSLAKRLDGHRRVLQSIPK